MLSIVIITKNEEKNLPKLLTSIKAQDFKDYEVIVSDADSTDKTRDIAKKFGCKIVKGGLPARGRNNGARASKGDLLLFLDADVVLPEKFLSKNIDEFNRRRLSGATPLYISEENTFLFRLNYNIWNLIDIVTSYFYPHASGFCIFVKKKVFDEIGGFDETVNVGEDHDLAWRISKKGKFRVLKSVPVIASVRRFKKEGILKLSLKYLYAEFFRIIFGKVKRPIYHYEMQGVDVKGKV